MSTPTLDLGAIEWRLRDQRMMSWGPFSVMGFIEDEEALIAEVKRLRALSEDASELQRLREERDEARHMAATRDKHVAKRDAEIERLRSRNSELEADTKRLDWLQQQTNCVVTIDGLDYYLGDPDTTLREAIDAAMSEDKPA